MLLEPIPALVDCVPCAEPASPVASARAPHWSESVNGDKPSSVTFDTVEMPNRQLRLDKTKLGTPIPISYMRLPETTRKRLTRPASLYKEEYCEELVALMSAGYSFSACAGLLGVTLVCLNNWCEAHPAFAFAYARGKMARLSLWETLGIEVAMTGGTGSQANMIYNGLKNQGSSEWREKQEVTHSGAISLASLVESSLKNITPRQTIDLEAESAPMQLEHRPSEA